MAKLSKNSDTHLDYAKLLQGRYEVERLPKDFSPERAVPDYAFNVLNPLGLIYMPVVDDYFLQKGGKRPVWPEGKPFAVCLTHDVDAVSLYSVRQSLKYRLGALLGASSTLEKMKALLAPSIDLTRVALNSWKGDPLHCYESWLEVEKQVGAQSTFFFWPGWSNIKNHHSSDCTYELYDRVVFDNEKCTVAEMIQEIDERGWEIGLHSSWYSFDDVDELKRQKERLEKVVGHDIVSVRQHCLHYDIRSTPRVHSQAGFKYDSTLGFNHNVGFRLGTCYPYHLYDLKEEKELPIREIPLIIQDAALLDPDKGMRLDDETAFQYFNQIAGHTEKVGGVLTLLWHSNHLIKSAWWALYFRILRYLEQKNVWFASVKEVGEYWDEEFEADYRSAISLSK